MDRMSLNGGEHALNTKELCPDIRLSVSKQHNRKTNNRVEKEVFLTYFTTLSPAECVKCSV